MSDSDEMDVIPSFQKGTTVVTGSGPNRNFSLSTTGLSYRSNLLSSTRLMPIRPRYAQSNYDQRSVNSRRAHSPMSVRSACGAVPRSNDYSFGCSAVLEKSIYDRGRSPTSDGSMDSKASTSSYALVAHVLKSEKFSRHELQALSKLINKKVRPRFERKRNRIEKRRYHKIPRFKNSHELAMQENTSSESSDDQSIFRDNISRCRSTITDISKIRKTIQDRNLYRDQTNNLKHNAIQNNCRAENLNYTDASIPLNRSLQVRQNIPLYNMSKVHNKQAIMLQKDRFTNGFLLPCQRFNGPGDSIAISVNEHHNSINPQQGDPSITNGTSVRNVNDSDAEDLFTNTNKQDSKNMQRKRSSDTENNILPTPKRGKILSPCKNSKAMQRSKANDQIDDIDDDFVFAKPTFPVRKSVKGKLIEKSIAPLCDTLIEAPVVNILHTRQEEPVEEDKGNHEDEQTNSTQNSTNLSMRPSFIKRKLFTQKLDVSEKRNLSIDNLNSPQNSMYGNIQKDKHKARKLQQAMTQSCLSRDIQQDSSNLLELIHKIVPKDQMNITSQTNKTDTERKNTTEDTRDKWDVSSIISTRKSDEDLSDTYTDEEILNSTVKQLQKEKSKEHERNKQCKDNVPVPDKISKENVATENASENFLLANSKTCNVLIEKLSINKDSLPLRSFWDTDFESDVECQPSSRTGSYNSKQTFNSKPDIRPKEERQEGVTNSFNFKEPTLNPANQEVTTSSNTFDVHKFNFSALKICSHRCPRKYKLDKTMDQTVKSSVTELESKKHESLVTSDLLKQKTKAKQPKETAAKKVKSSPKGTKNQAPKTDKNNGIAKKSNCNKDVTKNESKKTLEKTKTNKNDINNKNTPEKLKTNKKESSTKNLPAKPKGDTKENNKNNEKKNNTSTSTVNEENNNIKPVRSCRNKSINLSADMINLPLNETANRTLRSRLNGSIVECSGNTTSTKTLNAKNLKNKNNEKKNNLSTSTVNEENNNIRPVRSCRNKSINLSADKINLPLNETTNRTLKSRLNGSIVECSGNNKTAPKRDNRQKNAKSTLNDVSLPRTVASNTDTKRTIKRVYAYMKADESDVSFTLGSESPIARRTRAYITGSSLTESPCLLKDSFISNHRVRRARVSNKKYF